MCIICNNKASSFEVTYLFHVELHIFHSPWFHSEKLDLNKKKIRIYDLESTGKNYSFFKIGLLTSGLEFSPQPHKLEVGKIFFSTYRIIGSKKDLLFLQTEYTYVHCTYNLYDIFKKWNKDRKCKAYLGR